jgi:hypothetical protein
MKEVESPCIKVCQYDSKDVCFGCQRTREEAGNWSLYSNEQKAEIIRKTRERGNVRGEAPGGFMR